MRPRDVSLFLAMLFVPLVPALRAAEPAKAKPAGKPQAAKPKPDSVFLRLTRDGDRPVALETAITRLTAKDGPRKGIIVDLVGAVHIGEKGYYEQLNREFKGYDVVLYELVAPEGTRIPKGGKREGGDHPLSMLQKGMKDLLELEFQLDQIDYTRKNFVHADMSPDQFAKSMKDRGESITGLFLRMFGYAMAKQGEGSGNMNDFSLLAALLDKNRALALKRVMAEQFQDMEGMTAVLGDSTLISQRNKAALEVLRKQIAAGKRRIAIFYGAGHMPDFQTRLEKDFHLSPAGTRWLVAWDLKDRNSNPKRQRGTVRQH
jgi:hypothetical protein